MTIVIKVPGGFRSAMQFLKKMKVGDIPFDDKLKEEMYNLYSPTRKGKDK